MPRQKSTSVAATHFFSSDFFHFVSLFNVNGGKKKKKHNTRLRERMNWLAATFKGSSFFKLKRESKDSKSFLSGSFPFFDHFNTKTYRFGDSKVSASDPKVCYYPPIEKLWLKVLNKHTLEETSAS